MEGAIKGLYIHIPFCNCICSYCDFYKMIANEKTKEKYVNHLVKEIIQKQELMNEIETIYIGGGSPSCLSLNLIEKIFIELNRIIDFSKITEFTVECNPMDITEDLCLLFKKYHINRVSIGVQSFNKEKLMVLTRNYINESKEKNCRSFRRIHSFDDVKKAIKKLQDCNINNINCDFIYGIGNESFKLFKNDLQKAISLGITHLSTYSLILEERTILGILYKKGEFALMDPDYEYKFYTKIQKYLEFKGFHQYEISNFTKNNMQSKHNLIYWNNQNYLGIGASASYYINNVRYTNVFNLKKYFEGIDSFKPSYSEEIVLTTKDKMNEEIMLGLRKISGIDLDIFEKKFNTSIYKEYPVINTLIKNKLLKRKKKYLYIPKRKLYVSNEILIKLI